MTPNISSEKNLYECIVEALEEAKIMECVREVYEEDNMLYVAQKLSGAPYSFINDVYTGRLTLA